jgi:hypothetical protein
MQALNSLTHFLRLRVSSPAKEWWGWKVNFGVSDQNSVYNDRTKMEDYKQSLKFVSEAEELK